jgi:hypothetical protein
VKLSQLGAGEDPGKGRFQRYHGAVENYIRAQAFPSLFCGAISLCRL